MRQMTMIVEVVRLQSALVFVMILKLWLPGIVKW